MRLCLHWKDLKNPKLRTKGHRLQRPQSQVQRSTSVPATVPLPALRGLGIEGQTEVCRSLCVIVEVGELGASWSSQHLLKMAVGSQMMARHVPH